MAASTPGGRPRPVGPSDEPNRYRVDRLVTASPVATWHGVHRREELAFEVLVEFHPAADAEAARVLLRRFHWAADLAAALDEPAAVPPRDLFLTTVEGDLVGAGGSSWAVCAVRTWNEGLPLDDWAAASPRDATSVVEVVGGLVRVVRAMHDGVGGVPMVHRNLAPQSVRVANGAARVEGFGSARPISDTTEPYPGLQAPWAPPEAATGRFGAASDAWCVGALTVLALTGAPPPPGDPGPVLLTAPALGGSGEAALHVASILAADPDDRPELVSWFERFAELVGVPVGRVVVPVVREVPRPAVAGSGAEATGGSAGSGRDAAAPAPTRAVSPVMGAVAAALIAAAGVGGFLLGGSGGSEPSPAAEAADGSTTTTSVATAAADGAVEAADSFDGRSDLSGGDLAWEVASGTWSVADGAAVVTEVPEGQLAIAVVDAEAANLGARATFSGLTAGSGLLFRYESPTDYFLLSYLPFPDDPDRPYVLLRVKDGAVGELDRFEGPADPAAEPVELGVDLDGGLITAHVGGEVAGRVTSQDGAGRPMVGIAAIAGSEAGLRVDDVRLGPPGS